MPITKRTAVARLTKLIEVFESARKLPSGGYKLQLDDRKVLFDIGTWATDRTSGGTERPSYATSCGTAACVAGTAGLIPSFRRAGLRTNIRESCVRLGSADFAPMDDDAFAKFFGVSAEQANDICWPHRYVDEFKTEKPTPAQVVSRLREIRAEVEAS